MSGHCLHVLSILQPHCPMFARKIRSNAKQFVQTKCLHDILFVFGLNTKQRVIIMLPNATCIFCFNDQLNSMQKVVSTCYLALGKVLVFEKKKKKKLQSWLVISVYCTYFLFLALASQWMTKDHPQKKPRCGIIFLRLYFGTLSFLM